MMMTTTTTENNNNKKKRQVGLAIADADTVKRIAAMDQKARALALKKMKEESGGLPLKMGLGASDPETLRRVAFAG
jgi:hypothetical protein